MIDLDNYKREIEIITQKVQISGDQLQSIPEKQIAHYVKSEMSRRIGDYILNNFDKLPIRYDKMRNDLTLGIDYEISLNIISNKELNRLKEIEYMYKELCK